MVNVIWPVGAFAGSATETVAEPPAFTVGELNLQLSELTEKFMQASSIEPVNPLVPVVVRLKFAV